MRFGERMKIFREKAKLTQLDLANRVGVKKSYISMVETGKRKQVLVDFAVKIANALNITLDDLAGNIHSGSESPLIIPENAKLGDTITINRGGIFYSLRITSMSYSLSDSDNLPVSDNIVLIQRKQSK